MLSEHEKFMAAAIKQAQKGEGQTSPNPMVGALIVKDGRVLSRGYHKRAGLPHAEVEALKKMDFKAQGCSLYVNLEPCNHHGRTGPCTEAIIQSGISKVFIGSLDPNPHVQGQGSQKLQAAGLKVKSGILAERCQKLNAWFEKYITTGLPYITLKLAASLDGKIATCQGDSKWISNPKSRHIVHRMRMAHDAVMVGTNTVLQDNPRLSCRLVVKRKVKQPVKVILDPLLSTPKDANLFTSSKSKTIIFTSQGMGSRGNQYHHGSVKIEEVSSSQGLLNLEEILGCLGAQSITSILVEGGGYLGTNLLKNGLVDKMMLFIAPILIGGTEAPSIFQGQGFDSVAEALRLKELQITRIEDNLLVCGRPQIHDCHIK